MACEHYLTSMQERTDGSISAIRRAELERHLDECPDCRALADDVQRIHDAAAALPPIDPPGHIWMQTAGRLRQEGRIRDVARASNRSARRGWLAAAAAVIVAAGGSFLVYSARDHRPAAPAAVTTQTASAGNAAPAKSVETVQTEVEQAQQQFESAIGDLEKVAKANQGSLDPATSATIDKNLGIIDQAIAENRAAVKAEPASVAARETLFDALRQKVSLLQDTIALINEMRQGNNAAAARLVNKS